MSMLLSGAGQCENQSEMQVLDMMFSDALLCLDGLDGAIQVDVR